jgi:hypothetical protein
MSTDQSGSRTIIGVAIPTGGASARIDWDSIIPDVPMPPMSIGPMQRNFGRHDRHDFNLQFFPDHIQEAIWICGQELYQAINARAEPYYIYRRVIAHSYRGHHPFFRFIYEVSPHRNIDEDIVSEMNHFIEAAESGGEARVFRDQIRDIFLRHGHSNTEAILIANYIGFTFQVAIIHGDQPTVSTNPDMLLSQDMIDKIHGLSKKQKSKPKLKTSEIKKSSDFKNYKQAPIQFLLKTYKENPDQHKALNYALTFAERTRTDISNWDLLTILTDTNDELTTDKREINKRMSSSRTPNELLDSEIQEQEKVEKEIDLSALASANMDQLVQNLNLQKHEILKKYEKAHKELIRAREMLIPVEEQLHVLLKVKDDKNDFVKNQLKEIQANGIFEVIKFDARSNSFYFKNIFPFIINLEKKFQEGSTTKVELGFFEIRVNFMTFDTYLKPTEENAKNVMFYHHGPFLSSGDGKLCFGAEVKKVDEYRKSKDLVKHLRLIYDVMTQFTSGVTPHRQITEFVAEQFDINQIKESGLIEFFAKGIPSKIPKKIKQKYKDIMTELNQNESPIAYDFVFHKFLHSSYHQFPPCPICNSGRVRACECVNGDNYEPFDEDL